MLMIAARTADNSIKKLKVEVFRWKIERKVKMTAIEIDNLQAKFSRNSS